MRREEPSPLLAEASPRSPALSEDAETPFSPSQLHDYGSMAAGFASPPPSRRAQLSNSSARPSAEDDALALALADVRRFQDCAPGRSTPIRTHEPRGLGERLELVARELLPRRRQPKRAAASPEAPRGGGGAEAPRKVARRRGDAPGGAAGSPPMLVASVMRAVRYYHCRASPWRPPPPPPAEGERRGAREGVREGGARQGGGAAACKGPRGRKRSESSPHTLGTSRTCSVMARQGEGGSPRQPTVDALMRAVRYYHSRSVPLR
ncbi:hypothetical protein AB1Y20_018318 [Prymnesium parvum]|uniref:Uncharacterized protein n=1 Tax=Prymnesium parvum TaxID=97485 RepID=A0AB34JRK2_PRYPA